MKTLLITTGFIVALQLGTTVAQEVATKESASEKKKADVEITIEGNDSLQFNKKEFSVQEGQTVALTFSNVGKVPKNAAGHNIVIVKEGTNVPAFAIDCIPNARTSGLPVKKEHAEQVIVATKILGPGESETVVFTAPTAGKYDYLCTFTGHFGVMKGIMTVEGK